MSINVIIDGNGENTSTVFDERYYCKGKCKMIKNYIEKANFGDTGFSYTLSLISGKHKMVILYCLWEDLEVQASRSGFNEVFIHTNMIFAKAKAKQNILEEFREAVLTKVAPKELIDDILEPYAEAYTILTKKKYVAAKNVEQVNQYLFWLNKVGNSDWALRLLGLWPNIKMTQIMCFGLWRGLKGWRRSFTSRRKI